MEYKNMTQLQIMESHIAAYNSSGDSVKEYCLKHKINRSSFYYWQKKSQPQPSGKFISITPSLTNAPVSIVFTNGNRICFESMPPAAYLKQLLG
jgi:hypothetical protein